MNSYINLKFFIFVFVTSSSLVFLFNCQDYDDEHLSLTKTQVALFFFGDSVFDAGNNNYINTSAQHQANFWPYGETFFGYPTGRPCDGRMIPDFIAEFANLPLIPTYLPFGEHDQFTYGVNFASSGSGALVETHRVSVISLQTQLNYFKTLEKTFKKKQGDEEAETLLSEAVYLFSTGINDYFVFFTSNSSDIHFSENEYVGMVIGNLTDTINEIYKTGARKFAFVNMLPLGCAPSVKALFLENKSSCVEDALKLVQLHNKELSKVLKELESQLKGFKYAIHDLYTSVSERINNPSEFGFKEITACCGTGPYRGTYSCGGKRRIKKYELCQHPSEYLFFDSFHFSEEANKQIAELMWSGTPDVTGPYNLKTLFELI